MPDAAAVETRGPVAAMADAARDGRARSRVTATRAPVAAWCERVCEATFG